MWGTRWRRGLTNSVCVWRWAARRDVLVLVTGRALRLTALGLALGSILAFVVAKAAQSMLFRVVTMRASMFVGFTFLLLLVALVAAWVPARRASEVDPIALSTYSGVASEKALA